MVKLDIQAKMPMTGKNGRYSIYDINNIGYVDIETTNLKAQVGHAVSIVNHVRDVIKDRIVETRVYEMSKAEHDDSIKRGVMEPNIWPSVSNLYPSELIVWLLELHVSPNLQ